MRSEHKIKIIYEDKSILVVEKNAGELCISDGHEAINTLYHKVHNYLHEKNCKAFIVHRLDKDTSGVVLFAKNAKVKKLYQDNWEKIAVSREYIAIVDGSVKKDKDTIVNYISENKNYKSYIDDKNGKKSITEYEVIEKNSKYSVLKVKISTGRKNQIRLTLSSIGHPILGDKKYGNISSSIRRMCLHAYVLKIIDPITKEQRIFKSNIPNNFKVYIKKDMD